MLAARCSVMLIDNPCHQQSWGFTHTHVQTHAYTRTHHIKILTKRADNHHSLLSCAPLFQHTISLSLFLFLPFSPSSMSLCPPPPTLSMAPLSLSLLLWVCEVRYFSLCDIFCMFCQVFPYIEMKRFNMCWVDILQNRFMVDLHRQPFESLSIG